MLQIQATDQGIPSLSSTAQISIKVTPAMNYSKYAPSIKLKNHIVKISEKEPVGSLVVTIQATDEDSKDLLWYKITGKAA